jgi:WD40-like Beta Propeller Repeat
MVRKWFQRVAPRLVAGLTLGALALGMAAPAAAAPFDGQRTQFADERFGAVWARTDGENVRGGRSWYWGPNPWFDYAEYYRQGTNGLRAVQYFDKARMEINIPDDRSGPQRGVTNGLLVKELVSGRLQLGNDPFDADTRTPADVPVAGNPRNANAVAPGYGSFAGVATTDNGYRDPQRLGERVSTTLDRSGNLGARSDLAVAETTIVQYNTVTGHNIPQVFWDFMNLQGRIAVGGGVSTGPVVDWLFAMGLPISDAYWVRAQVGGETKDVLVQLFERRVLTYVPSNPAGYKVEMGNVGQHYFQWRYPHLGTPWAAPDPSPTLLYASNEGVAGGHWEIFAYFATGRVQLTQNSAESVAFSYRRSYEPKQTRLLIDSRRSGQNMRQIYELNPEVLYGGVQKNNADVRRLTYSDGLPVPNEGPYPGYLPNNKANEYNASYSPDGTKIVFISDRTGNPEIFIMNPTGNFPVQLTSNDCVNEVPTWSPDGRTLYWMSNCSGNVDLYRADLSYRFENSYGVDAFLVNQRQLTNSPGNDRYPRVSPDGRQLAFASDREGQEEIYLISAVDGTGERRLTSNSAADNAPSWSADGQRLAFASNRDGDYEIFTMDRTGNTVTQLTNNSAEDRWPLWAQ